MPSLDRDRLSRLLEKQHSDADVLDRLGRAIRRSPSEFFGVIRPIAVP